jgi:hypothetical protein
LRYGDDCFLPHKLETQAAAEAGFMDARFPGYDGLWLTITLAATCQVIYVDDILLDKRDHPAGDAKQWRVEDHMRDLRGVYRALLPMLHAHAAPQERESIVASWRRLLGPGVGP